MAWKDEPRSRWSKRANDPFEPGRQSACHWIPEPDADGRTEGRDATEHVSPAAAGRAPDLRDTSLHDVANDRRGGRPSRQPRLHRVLRGIRAARSEPTGA